MKLIYIEIIKFYTYQTNYNLCYKDKIRYNKINVFQKLQFKYIQEYNKISFSLL